MESLRKRDVPVFTDPYEAVSCMGAMYTYYRYLKDPPGRIDPVSLDIAQIEEVIRKVKEGQAALSSSPMRGRRS